ncbi:recombinase family protein [Paracoccus sp. (in: a-proteobacteria)]|uniref:recombinase family protein n=1 Tax=Paracoccus sp. TaxID=267 RepID=UPI002AFE194A|nr:recombinase family protein [Paracoccus sp. (in: a-proteobacteria)]
MAAYVRMSTDHQKYSTDNQMDAIRGHAAKNGIEIVRVYADEGKSGCGPRAATRF